MKRDDELIRKILMAIEESAGPPGSIVVDGYDETIVNRHVELLEDAGFVEAHLLRSAMPPFLLAANVERLTWEGHEFLADARNETVWKKARARVAKVGGGVSLDVLRATLVAVAKSELGLDV